LEAGVSGRVVGVTEYVLPELIKAVQGVRERNVVGFAPLCVFDVAEERALNKMKL
jgi:hypothetical protein